MQLFSSVSNPSFEFRFPRFKLAQKIRLAKLETRNPKPETFSKPPC